jgi:hypothetical protein
VLSNLLAIQFTIIALRGTEDDVSYHLLTTASSSSKVDPLAPPQGHAVALPSVQVDANSFSSEQIYGGKGDKPHLGGFTDLDHHGVSPAVWKWMVQEVGVHSLLDVGCGRGISTSWFLLHGVKTLCVEGSHDAVQSTVLPDPATQVVEHDFSRGPWWPSETYDAVWSVEFLEHVGRNFQPNYLPAFRKAALIFVTNSIWGGHHHVEVHDEEYWIHKFTMFGFVYSEKLSNMARKVAFEERTRKLEAPNGVYYNAQHLWVGLKIFINPYVASLPQHVHLLAEPGCYDHNDKDGHRINRECGTGNNPTAKMESVLPPEYRALNITKEQDEAWYNHIKARVKHMERPETNDGYQ